MKTGVIAGVIKSGLKVTKVQHESGLILTIVSTDKREVKKWNQNYLQFKPN